MEKSMISEKQSMRNKYLDYRNSLTAEERREKSRQIIRRLKEEQVFKEAGRILVYMDYRSEVITTGLVEELLETGEKMIYAPKVEGMDIKFYRITSLADLKEGYQKIREPEGSKETQFTEDPAKQMKNLVLVPGAVFDREGGRMGYGKGFYDRFLAANPEIFTAALAFECQIAKKVPGEAHDQKVDLIITEKEVIGRAVF